MVIRPARCLEAMRDDPKTTACGSTGELVFVSHIRYDGGPAVTCY